MAIRALFVSAACALALSACATQPNNPNYQYSTQYKGSTPYQTASTTTVNTQPAGYITRTPTQTTYATTPAGYSTTTSGATTYATAANGTTYQTSQRVNHECLSKETNRQLIGGVAGGALGAYAGKELIGGTAGAVVGAVAGGAAGYGIADKTIDCDPITTVTPVPATSATYHSYSQPQTQAAGTNPTIVAADGTRLIAAPDPLPNYEPHAMRQGAVVSAQPQVAAPVQQAAPQPVQAPRPVTPYAAAQPAPQPTYTAPAQPAYGATTGTYTAPTDRAYQNTETVGTPGWHAMMAAGQQPSGTYSSAPAYQGTTPYPSTTQPTPMPSMPSVPQATTTTASAPVTQPFYSFSTGLHQVVKGDTLYNLSKRLCVGVADIQQINGIGGDFKIRLGETIKLPASRC